MQTCNMKPYGNVDLRRELMHYKKEARRYEQMLEGFWYLLYGICCILWQQSKSLVYLARELMPL